MHAPAAPLALGVVVTQQPGTADLPDVVLLDPSAPLELELHLLSTLPAERQAGARVERVPLRAREDVL